MSELTTKIKTYISAQHHSEGEVGIEVEVEGQNLYKQNTFKYWAVHEDGSLRGENAEYVLRKPVSRDFVGRALEQLNKKMVDARPVFSHRTSVHIHINAQELTGLEVYKWITMYTIFEGLLMEYCGETRKGNLFCLSMADSQGIVDSLRDAVQNKRPISQVYSQETMRYAALNTAALGKFGSLEFRALYGTLDPEVILPWVDVLLAIKDKSMEYTNPIEILEAFSTMGAERFLENVIPADFLVKLPKDFDFVRSMSENMWLAQEFVFQSDWKTRLKKKQDTYVNATEHERIGTEANAVTFLSVTPTDVRYREPIPIPRVDRSTEQMIINAQAHLDEVIARARMNTTSRLTRRR